MHFPKILLKNLITNEDFTKRVLPYIENDYFQHEPERAIHRNIKNYIEKYAKPPSFEALYIELSNENLTTNQFDEVETIFNELKNNSEKSDLDWLINKTEEFCQEKAIYNGIMKSISILDGTNKNFQKGAIPTILTDALAVSFDTSIGHDYFDDFEKRFEYYHRKQEKIPTGLEYLDKVTKGGFNKKTLNLFLAGPHVGKTALMCSLASYNLMDGHNVLYITMEMAEEEITRRIDANLMNITIDDLMSLNKEMFEKRIQSLRTKTAGKLKVKEYPTGNAHAGHFRQLLNELKLKQGFEPNVIYVDYLNICSSSRIKTSANMTSYTYVKYISEELRGLGIETEVPVVSASQFNRMGSVNSDPEMGDISESFGVNFSSDFTSALVTTEELIQQNKVMVKQLKNRYDDMNRIPRFFIGFDRPKMRFYDIDNPTKDISNSQLVEHQPIGGGFDGFKF